MSIGENSPSGCVILPDLLSFSGEIPCFILTQMPSCVCVCVTVNQHLESIFQVFGAQHIPLVSKWFLLVTILEGQSPVWINEENST